MIIECPECKAKIEISVSSLFPFRYGSSDWASVLSRCKEIMGGRIKRDASGGVACPFLEDQIQADATGAQA
jgi:hypothetical protein